MKSCEAFAPATVANVSVGYDNLGFALKTIGDKVRVALSKDKKVTLRQITCESYIDKTIVDILPKDSELNTATVGLIQLIEDMQLPFGFDVEIKKGIPIGSGLGGSAASAVASIVAANHLLPKPLSTKELLPYALRGEAAATGVFHGDNVGPCLLGGLTLTPSGTDAVVELPFPENLNVVSVYPGFRLDTKKARAVLPEALSLNDHVVASGRLAGFLASCHNDDLELMKASLQDDIIEPARAPLIKGFSQVQKIALDMGCLLYTSPSPRDGLLSRMPSSA